MEGKFEENSVSNYGEKRKSKSRKRKKSINEDEKNIYNEINEIEITEKIYNGLKMKNKDKTSNEMQNIKQIDILKKKKKKVYLNEKLNCEVDYGEKYNDHNHMNFKKKKKRCRNNIENPEFQKVKENTDSRLQIETNAEIIHSETSAEIINTDFDSESINSLYSHNYTMGPKKLNSQNGTPGMRRKRQVKPTMYEDYLYKPPVIEEKSCGKIENIPNSHNYWVRQNAKFEVENYPQETVQKDLLERIQYIIDYFERFDSGNLTKVECQEKELSNFDGPYLPTPKHMDFFGNLNIEIDWEVPEEQQVLFFHLTRTIRKKGISFVRHAFLKSEDKIMLDNWKKFQEQYKFHDIRPILGIRSMRVHREGEQYIFESVDYLDSNERYKFLLYIARGLEKRTRQQVFHRIRDLVMKIQDNEIIYRNRNFEPEEVAEIEAFIKLFGADFRGMEFFLGRTNESRYKIFSKLNIKYRNVPMRIGAWQSTEISRLIRATFRTTNASSIHELINSKINWSEVFPLFQTRNHHMCQAYFNYHIKRKLEVASYLTKHEADTAKLNWTPNNVIKLLKLISENLGPTINETDWEKISSHFEVFGPNCCLYRFIRTYENYVPRNKKTTLRGAVDFMVTDVIPQIEKGLIVLRGREYNLQDLRNLPLKKDKNTKSSHDWSLKNTIKLIKVVYQHAGSTVETTSWSEISSYFKNKDEKSCKNHFRFLFYNRIPHKHRASFDSALEYLHKFVYPMLKQKKERNVRESLLLDEVVNLSSEDRSILQALQNDFSQADDDEDIAMLQENNEQMSQNASVDCHEISSPQKLSRINELADYIQERKEEDEIDGDLEDFNDSKIDRYLEDLDREENEYLHLSSKGDITGESFIHDEGEYCSNEDSRSGDIENKSSIKEIRFVNDCDEYQRGKLKKKKNPIKSESRKTHDLSDEDE